MHSVRILIVALLGAALVSCKSDDITTSEMAVTARSRVTGIVNSTDGLPVANARLFIMDRGDSRCGFRPSDVSTNARGEFSYPVERMFCPETRPTPDTITMSVEAYWQQSPNGAGRSGSTLALLFFRPPDKASPTTAVTVILDRANP